MTGLPLTDLGELYVELDAVEIGIDRAFSRVEADTLDKRRAALLGQIKALEKQHNDEGTRPDTGRSDQQHGYIPGDHNQRGCDREHHSATASEQDIDEIDGLLGTDNQEDRLLEIYRLLQHKDRLEDICNTWAEGEGF